MLRVAVLGGAAAALLVLQAAGCAGGDELDRGPGSSYPDAGSDDAGRGDSRVPGCGDEVLDPGEQCDGAELAGKTCLTLGMGFVGGTLRCLASCQFDTSQCRTRSTCGNGFRDEAEECEGDDLGGATCESLGFIAGEVTCTDSCTIDASGCSTCGNDAAEGAEVCDGSDHAGKTCETLGHSGGTLACAGDCGSFDESGCDDCGNGVAEGTEECDDEDLRDKGCQDVGAFVGGTLACAGDCTFDTAGCTLAPTCPNGVVDPGEQCDGANLDGKSCEVLGYTGGVLSCKPGCAFDTSKCYTCGNGTLEGAEVCDATNLGGKNCVALGHDGGVLACGPGCLTFDESGCTDCGDGAVEGTEQCDGTNLNGAICASVGPYNGGVLACTGTCQFDTGGCTQTPTCPNGAIDPGEQCDGSDLNGQRCDTRGFTDGSLGCTGSCTFDESGCYSCGNDKLEGPEVCDGTNLDGETCKSLGHDGGTLLCHSRCLQFDETGCTDCGNGRVEPGEQCDPPGPGCDASCQLVGCDPLAEATWYHHHLYDPVTSPASVANNQFAQAEIAATRFALPAGVFPLTITHVRVLAAAQSYTLRIYGEAANEPGAVLHSQSFLGDTTFQVVELSSPVSFPTQTVFWIGLQGASDGMFVYGDGDGESTTNLIWGCDSYLPPFCLGTWAWRTFDSYGPTFASVDDLILSAGSCP